MVYARVIAWGGYESMHGRWPAQLTRFKGSEQACTSLKRARGSEGGGGKEGGQKKKSKWQLDSEIQREDGLH